MRAESRSFIVDDLDAALATVEELLGWPAPPVVESTIDDCRVALYRPAVFPGSTHFELLEPRTTEGLVAEHRARYGAGAYRITFAVDGLDAAGDALGQRGVRYVLDRDNDEARIRLDPDQLGMIVDLVDYRVRA